MSSLLDQAIKVGQELEGASQRVAKAEKDYEVQKRAAQQLKQDAEAEATRIVSEAKAAAQQLSLALDARQLTLDRREQEVAIKEGAVAGVDVKEAQLRQRLEDLGKQEAALKEARASASGAEDRWRERMKELEQRELNVQLRESALRA